MRTNYNSVTGCRVSSTKLTWEGSTKHYDILP